MISNSTIKQVQSLKHKKFRQKYHLFVAEGVKIVLGLLEQDGLMIDTIYTCINIQSKKQLQHPDVVQCGISDLKKISQLQSTPEAIAIVRIPYREELDYGKIKRAIYLDNVQDPGNVGTIIRLADWYGVDTVMRSPGSADFYGGKVIQSTMGSIANLSLHTVTAQELVELSKLQLVASNLSKEKPSVWNQQRPTCLIIGHEGKGVSDFLLAHADVHYTIPGAATRVAESLNAAVATAILCDRLFSIQSD